MHAPNPLKKRLRWPLRLTWAGIVGERFLRSFWPAYSVAFVMIAAFLLGLHEQVSLTASYVVFGVLALGLLVTIVRGAIKFRFPSRAEAYARLDGTLVGYPIATLLDAQTVGAEDPASRAVWEAHLQRMEARIIGARAPSPNLRLADRDPNGFRLMAVLALLVALIFGAPRNFMSVPILSDRLAVGAATGGSLWEGWVQPPRYTGKPNLYLNDLTDRSSLSIPQGSTIALRFYAPMDLGDLEQDIAELVPDEDAVGSSEQVTIMVNRSGTLEIDSEYGGSWRIEMLPDDPPKVFQTAEAEGTLDGELIQEFTAQDDYGVASGSVQFALDMDNVARRYGLAVEPESTEGFVLDLPLPYTSGAADFDEVFSEDFAAHPWAGLPVIMKMQVWDDLDQQGDSGDIQMLLPKRKFFDPLAASVVEMRRDLLWSRENGERAEQVLKAVTNLPEDLEIDESGYLMLRVAIGRLATANQNGLDKAETTEIADDLWEIALRLEEGGLDDAKARMERAQDRLSEAMERGASDAEIAELMDELRAATDAYMSELARNSEGGEQQAQNQEGADVSQDEIDALMDQIQELMEQGRMAEAQQLLDMLREMMENMQVTQGTGSNGSGTPSEQSMEGLQETLRDQRDLSDEVFRDLQEQYNPPLSDGQTPSPDQGQEPQEGEGSTGEDQQGEGGGNGTQENDRGQPGGSQSLADRQQALRDSLREQGRNLPSDLDGEAGEALDRAGRAMEDARDALDNDDIPLALDRQSEAIEALREGMRAIGEAMAADAQGREGEQGEGALSEGREGGDPLGRVPGTGGTTRSEGPLYDRQTPYGQARELLEELRRREGDKTRPELELDYLRRLMDQF
ncbi:TIGR02302 family protein [Falsihalocynthiibacter sp. SS001]|uniref:TIGR02302 family protein n=1 Tax=Falsihalocynthiibacter sp. SS001 TaxID=3349698 RepID=UPI0036D342BD